jgi:hypothetical protein
MRVLQIVPHLPPPYEGVGTYAESLAGALGAETRFLVGDPSWSGGGAVAARTARDLLAGLGDAGTVLLHYANYGYQRRGCPAWLVDGLDRWPGRLVTLFHEVWASGPPWRSSFWTLPVQRRLAAALVRRSSGVATTLDRYAEMLLPWTAGRKIVVMPVFSTVGEPAALPAFEERARRIVVFGGAGVRARAWGRFLPALTRAARALAAEDVGPPIPPPASVGGAPVRPLGVLPAGEVSRILLGSAAGFLAYPPDFLAKSTIFAAYCAHGVVPVCAWDRPAGSPPTPCWTGAGDPAAAAAATHAWYQGHSLQKQAVCFRELLAA